MVIWKFKVEPGDFIRQLPAGAVVLSTGFVGDNVVFWALVDPEKKAEERKFFSLMTGEHRDAFTTTHAKFIGTVVMSDLVVHLFENCWRDGGIW